jgi:polysaccharide export outer membrane protein
MPIFTKSLDKKCISILSAILLCACATTSTPIPGVGSAENVKQDSAITPIVLPITNDLIKSQNEQRDRQNGQDLKRLIGVAKPYEIGPGDVLSIVVWGHPELAASATAAQLPAIGASQMGGGSEQPPAGFVVDHNGLLQYPYAGVIDVSGHTEIEARDLLTTKISSFINKPIVTLRVQSYRSKRVYVSGEVRAPGLFAINDIPMTLVEALNRAGGVLPTGDLSQITINRSGIGYQINLPKLMQSGIEPESILLAQGDVVRVLSRDENKVFVTGEVNSPKALTMHDGRLTLNEALGESGGINPLSGDTRQIFVVRKSTSTQPIVYKLDASSSSALAIAENFELNPRDMVYVAPTTLTDWHRTISLLFPGELSAAIGAGKQP